MQYHSYVEKGITDLEFPENTGERVYMVPFNKSHRSVFLPRGLERWKSTVIQMMRPFDDCLAYLMIDQGVTEPGKTHRRPGLHVDGNWNPGISSHGHRPPGHNHPGPGHYHPTHIHAGRHGHRHAQGYKKEAIILATDVLGVRVLKGKYGADIDGVGAVTLKEGDLDLVYLEPNTVWYGNVTMLHESIPHSKAEPRTVVRINVPGYHH